MRAGSRKAVIFSLDVIIAISLMLIVIYNLSSIRLVSDSPSSKHSYLNMLAQDAIMLISQAKI